MVAQWNRQCLAAPNSNPKHNFYAYLSFELGCEKNENKQKEAGIGPSFNLSSNFMLYQLAKIDCGIQPKGIQAKSKLFRKDWFAH